MEYFSRHHTARKPSQADLLTFLVGAPPVADANLKHSQSALRDSDRDLGLESEAIFLNWDVLNHIPPESLVAGFHVGEIHVGQAVGK